MAYSDGYAGGYADGMPVLSLLDTASGGSATLTLTWTAAEVDSGDLILAVASAGHGGGAQFNSGPSGFTQQYLDDSSTISNHSFAVYAKVSDGTETTGTFTWNNSLKAGVAYAYVFKPTDGTALVLGDLNLVVESFSAQTSHATGDTTVDTTVAAAFLSGIDTSGTDGGWDTPAASWTAGVDLQAGVGNDSSQACARTETFRTTTSQTDLENTIGWTTSRDGFGYMVWVTASADVFTGTATPVQGADTASAAGSFTPLFTGTAAVTQAADTSSATGELTFTGTAAIVQAADTSTASGSYTPPPITGTATPTQAADTSTASGQLTFVGSANPTQAADTSAGSGTHTPPPISGSAAVTQAADTSSASGTHTAAGISGTAAPTQAADTSTASGTFTPLFSGSAAPLQASDTSSASGTNNAPGFAGNATTTQAADTATASGTHTAPVFTGTAALSQAADTASASGSQAPLFSGTATAVQAADTSTATATTVVTFPPRFTDSDVTVENHDARVELV